MENQIPTQNSSNKNGLQTNPEFNLQDSGLSENQNTPLKSQKKLKFNKNNLVLTILVILFVITGSIITFIVINQNRNSGQLTTNPAPTQFLFKASVVYLSGKASRMVDDRKIEIKEGDVLNENDQVQTDDNTKLVLSLDNGTVIRLGSNTQLRLSKLTFPETSINQDSGIIFVRVEKDENHKFIANAGGVMVESKGTAFSIENEEEVNVKVFENAVLIKEKNGDEIQVEENKEWNNEQNQIKSLDQEKLATNEFYNWSLKEEKLISPTLTPTAKPTSLPSQSQNYQIYLTGSAVDNGITFNWTVSGIDAPNGFKVIKNTTGNPVYPGDDFQYISKPEARSFTWKITDGATWHFRVCQYVNGGCGVYSNDITVKAPSSSTSGKVKEIVSQINSITLSVTKQSETSAKLTWAIDGTPPNGFKVIWSKTSGPTYPPRDGDWGQKLNSESREFEVGALQTGNTYFFRICEYLSSACGVYSNEVSANF